MNLDVKTVALLVGISSTAIGGTTWTLNQVYVKKSDVNTTNGVVGQKVYDAEQVGVRRDLSRIETGQVETNIKLEKANKSADATNENLKDILLELKAQRKDNR